MSIWAGVKTYVNNVLVSLDQFANAILGAPDDETISSRMERLDEKGNPIGKAGHTILDAIQTNHCENAVVNDEKRGEAIDKWAEKTESQEPKK